MHIGKAMAVNDRVIVTGCMGVEEGRIRAVRGVLAVCPHSHEQVVAAVHEAVPPCDPSLTWYRRGDPPDPVVRLREGPGRLQQPLRYKPSRAARRSASRPAASA